MRLLLQSQLITTCLLAPVIAQLPTLSPAPTADPTLIVTLPGTEISTLPIFPASPAPTFRPTNNIQTPAPIADSPAPQPFPVVDTPSPVINITPSPTDTISTPAPTDPASTPAPTDPPVTEPPSPSPIESTLPPVRLSPTFRPSPRPTTEEPTEVTPEPTPEPTKAPTSEPTPEPTPVATDTPVTPRPTPMPSPLPTRRPSPLPTGRPTNEPTTAEPTEEPTELPTMSPQVFPTTNRPTNRPTPKPSKAPTESPTFVTESPSISGKPSHNPSLSPSVSIMPSAVPSDLPTAMSSNVPSDVPTQTISDSPTLNIDSNSPSSAPSIVNSPVPTPATVWPTAPPKSTRPTDKLLGPTSVTNLKITLTGIDKVPNTNQWARSTASYFQDWYNRSSKDPLSVQYNIYDAEVKIYYEAEAEGVTRFLRRLAGGGRKLQSSTSVEVTYTQSTKYRTKDSSADIYEIVESPLEQQADRDVYVKTLKDMDGYEGLTDVSSVSVPGDGGDQIVDGGEDSGGLSTGAIIGIACGGVAGAILLGGLIYVSTRSDKDSEAGDRGASTQSQTLSSNQLSSSRFEPTMGDQSVVTMDYDYSKAYGGAGNYSLSDAGGTLGSRTRQTAADPALMPGSGGTIFSDDNTFDQAYEGVREELLDIYAPAGKLGVVIDTPNDGPPVVHAVKDTSPIADKIRVGDKLVAVDDEDVRDMTAIKVSKLISKKSTNASRKMTVIRTVAE